VGLFCLNKQTTRKKAIASPPTQNPHKQANKPTSQQANKPTRPTNPKPPKNPPNLHQQTETSPPPPPSPPHPHSQPGPDVSLSPSTLTPKRTSFSPPRNRSCRPQTSGFGGSAAREGKVQNGGGKEVWRKGGGGPCVMVCSLWKWGCEMGW